INQLISEQEEEEKIDEFLKKACITLDIEQPYVCDAIIDAFANELYFVVERVIFTPEELCGIFVDECGTPVNPLKVLWDLPVPGGKPAVKPWPAVNAPKKTQRVLHLSDIHIDRDYAEGSEADCASDKGDEPVVGLCCRNYPDVEGAPTASTKIRVPAGKWGSVNMCDLPYRTFDAAMRHISETHKDLDYIIITGDLEAHDMWDYTREKTQANIANFTQALIKYFPNTPIYESIGNHEGVPSDAMAPHNMEEYDTRGPSWLYNTLAQTWSRWISADSVKGVQYRASYVERPAPGLKLISINSVYCSFCNFYIYINQTDPDSTLTWLISELMDSEAKGEKVHIISHIPAGDDYCLKGWAHNFYEIVNRFENTIAAQFYGHTHNDHFQVYYEDSNPVGRPTHFNFITPSITTYLYNNPAYRIYTIDGGYEGASYTVLEAETYTTDLDEANAKDQEPMWFLEYSARDAYSMPDLSPASWSALIDRLAVDDDLFRTYHRYFFRSSYEDNCVNEPACRQKYVCYLRVAKSFEEDHFCAGFTTL
ncbi:asm-2, partial [Pristionchus pacificus]